MHYLDLETEMAKFLKKKKLSEIFMTIPNY